MYIFVYMQVVHEYERREQRITAIKEEVGKTVVPESAYQLQRHTYNMEWMCHFMLAPGGGHGEGP